MFEFFIKRPVLSLVISLLIVFVGILSMISLPVTQFPDIVPPSVMVTARYTGANAEACANAVATPLERAINGVPGMTYMTSTSSNNGVTLIQVFFKVGVDPDVAAVQVQNRVASVLDELPEEVIRAGVTTEKEVNSMLLYLNLYSLDSTAGEKFIYNFADINILPELKRIDGVGFAEIMGAKEYAMRVWLKPDRMLAYEVGTEEVIDAIRKQNIEAAPGKTGESSDKGDVQMLQYVLRYTGKFTRRAEYENLVIRANPDGSVLKLKDIATMEFGSLSYIMSSKTDGRPSASIMLKQRPGSNAKEVIENVKAKMAELKKSQFPPKMDYNFNYDVSQFLDASIKSVVKTLIEAFILVFIVVFLFLQDWRSTLIPALAVPVALIGTFAFMSIFGFSINLLTLFALVLAIGIVVDDAIVVVEAVHAKMEEKHIGPLEASIESMNEIGGAIVAITLVMSAVFIPVAFLSGPVGIFYRQFSITMAIAIVISGVNALTLTPALCALMLKPHGTHEHHGFWARFFKGFNAGYNNLEAGYKTRLFKMARHKFLALGITAVFAIALGLMTQYVPTGFIPTEDQGVIYVNVTTPPGATLERNERVLDEILEIAKNLKEVESVSTLAGYSLLNEVAGASYGMGMINLKNWDERKESVMEVIAQIEEKTKNLSDAEIQYFPPPTVPGFGNASGFEFRLIDRNRGGTLQSMDQASKKYIAALQKDPAIGSAFTNFNPAYPQYLISVDQDMAAKKGISVAATMKTLQTLMGSFYASNFIRFGQMYKVMVQADPAYRTEPKNVLEMYVKNDRGEMVPLNTFAKIDRVFGPDQITRYNMYNAVMINGDANPGYSSGQAIEALQRVGQNVLPKGFQIEWSGMTREQVMAGSETIFIFLICLTFVYLLLSAQYESFILPIAVITSLPAGIFGSFLGLSLMGLENNIYAQVSLVMLIGLLGKNAILIVEYAIQREQQGLTILEAALEGGVSRLRPILMTSFAFIAGLIPLVLAGGAGAIGNRSIGTAAAGGMLVGTLVGIFIIPGLYVLFASLNKKYGTKKA